jgi:DNA-directed RNA polymerase subunit RPC12/RpoP
MGVHADCWCGKRSSRRGLCSRHWREAYPEEAAEDARKKRMPLDEKVAECVDCGTSFTIQTTRPIRCVTCRARHKDELRKARARTPEGRALARENERKYRPRKRRIVVPCRYCGSPHETFAQPAWRRDYHSECHAIWRTQGKACPVPWRMCLECGERFISSSKRICSDECARQRKMRMDRGRSDGPSPYFDLRYGALGERAGIEAYAMALRRDPCAYCGREGGERDHIVPRVVLGGHTGGGYTSDEVSNLTGACPDCNVAKSDASLLEYLAKG